MKLLNDIHHLAFLTGNLARLIGFYERVFDARVTLDLEEDGLRHAFIEVGPHTVLHPFQVPGAAVPASRPMFERGGWTTSRSTRRARTPSGSFDGA